MRIKFSTLLTFPSICEAPWERDHVWGHPRTLCCLPGMNLEPGEVCICSSAIRYELTSFRCWSVELLSDIKQSGAHPQGSQSPMACSTGLFHVWPQAHWENGDHWSWGSDPVFVYFENSFSLWSGTISCLQEKGWGMEVMSHEPCPLPVLWHRLSVPKTFAIIFNLRSELQGGIG